MKSAGLLKSVRGDGVDVAACVGLLGLMDGWGRGERGLEGG